MRYHVVWRAAAENELAEIWITATDRNAVARAAEALEARLKLNPLEEGESREGSDRIAFQAPLAVAFSVSTPDHLVTVLQVWHIRLPRG